MGAAKQVMMEIMEQDLLIEFYEGRGYEKALDMTLRDLLDVTHYKDATVSMEAVLRRIRKESAREIIAEFEDKMGKGKEDE